MHMTVPRGEKSQCKQKKEEEKTSEWRKLKD